MFETTLIILFIALLLDWYLGEPDVLWNHLPHPVVIFGKAVSKMDKAFNREGETDVQKYRKGSVAVALLVILAAGFGFLLDWLFELIWPFGYLLEALIVFALLAQRSLHEHVQAVADGFAGDGLQGGREAVGMIVGRDPQLLDQSGVCRAGIESLAENFSDGVVAPAFWYAVFGLPGILAYKMINTADSMIGYKNEKYLWFGRTAAQIDDLANWLPARLSIILIAAGAGFVRGIAHAVDAIKTAIRDAGLHRSPNAGWPEGAMAGSLGIALGGARVYPGETVPQAFLNGAGRKELAPKDIVAALEVFAVACFALWVVVLLLLVLL